jgi:uncharacterized protein YeaO (DUF488 family)
MNKEQVGSQQAIDRFRTKRIYERPDPSDGTRILVDRLWPRGVTKGRAMVHVWMKEIAPSPALRTWFGHAPARWLEFRKQYADELTANEAGVRQLASLAGRRTSHALVCGAGRCTQSRAGPRRLHEELPTPASAAPQFALRVARLEGLCRFQGIAPPRCSRLRRQSQLEIVFPKAHA